MYKMIDARCISYVFYQHPVSGKWCPLSRFLENYRRNG
jgi:hypothetical protein